MHRLCVFSARWNVLTELIRRDTGAVIDGGECSLTRIVGIAVMLWLIVVCSFVRAAPEESPTAYEIVTAASVTVLPAPLQGFFETHLAALRQSATGKHATGSSGDGARESAGRHFVMLDIITDGHVRRFPQDRAEAMRLFKQRGVHDGGELPWVILDCYAALVRAFTSGASDALAQEAGTLLHFVTDAVLPFNTTGDRDGTGAGALHWFPTEAEAGSESHHTVRHRCQIVLLDRFRNRFDFEVRVFPGRRENISNPRQAVFDALFEAYDTIDRLVKIDAEVLAGLDIHDATTFAASADAYYQRLADRAAPIMETRLEAGALLGANLITAAWVEAGKPSIHTTPATSSVVRDRASPPKPVASPYVGSRNSTIFHKATCPHARRIKPENLVGFDSVGEAIRAGRTPCKTCKPEVP